MAHALAHMRVVSLLQGRFPHGQDGRIIPHLQRHIIMRVRIGSWACASLVVAAALALTAAAQEAAKPQAVERAMLGRHDQSGVPGKEIVIGTASLAPGAVIGFHTHSGDEAGYIVKGSVIWKVHGQPDKTLKAGDSFFNPRGSVHSVVGGEAGGTAFSTWIVDKGKPLLVPAPDQ